MTEKQTDPVERSAPDPQNPIKELLGVMSELTLEQCKEIVNLVYDLNRATS